MKREKERGSRGRPKDPTKSRAILRAARDLFLNEGVAGASMEAIAERAGVSKATVYSHFADKSELFRAVLAAETGDYQAPREDLEIKELDALRMHLVDFGNGLVSMLTRPGVLDLGRLLINEARHHPDQAAHFFARGPEATHRRLARILDAATSTGLIACDRPEVAADQLLSMWIGQRHLRQQLGLCPPPTPADIGEHVRRCVDVMLKAYRS